MCSRWLRQRFLANCIPKEQNNIIFTFLFPGQIYLESPSILVDYKQLPSNWRPPDSLRAALYEPQVTESKRSQLFGNSTKISKHFRVSDCSSSRFLTLASPILADMEAKKGTPFLKMKQHFKNITRESFPHGNSEHIAKQSDSRVLRWK